MRSKYVSRFHVAAIYVFYRQAFNLGIDFEKDESISLLCVSEIVRHSSSPAPMHPPLNPIGAVSAPVFLLREGRIKPSEL